MFGNKVSSVAYLFEFIMKLCYKECLSTQNLNDYLILEASNSKLSSFFSVSLTIDPLARQAKEIFIDPFSDLLKEILAF